MKTTLRVAALWLLFSPPVSAQQQTFQDTLLDRMVGNWVLSGMIAGAASTHDLVAEWVLGHQYLRFHEVAREKDSTGAPAYEAIVFIGCDAPTNRYTCLWLDVTGSGGLTGCEDIGLATPAGDDLVFIFGAGEESMIHTTFAYNRNADTWDWLIDNVKAGKSKPFGRLTMTRQ